MLGYLFFPLSPRALVRLQVFKSTGYQPLTDLGHRKPLLSKLIPTVTLSVGVVTFMFTFTYLPQGKLPRKLFRRYSLCADSDPVSVLFFVNGPLAAFTTVLLILSESSTIITVLSKNFLIADALVDTFDGVLVARNETGLVSTGRQLKSGSDPINKVYMVLRIDICRGRG
jgi:hypothetical protein